MKTGEVCRKLGSKHLGDVMMWEHSFTSAFRSHIPELLVDELQILHRSWLHNLAVSPTHPRILKTHNCHYAIQINENGDKL